MRMSLPCAALLVVLAPTASARAEVSVAVLGLEYGGEVHASLKPLLEQELVTGLTAAGLRVVVPEAQARSARCTDQGCWRRLAAGLRCRYLVEGRVEGEDRSYEIALQLIDGHLGRRAAEARERCEICGQQALGQRLELAASALRARIEASARAPARVQVITEPRGAALAVDGQPAGSTPRELELAPGSHQLSASAPGWIAVQRRFDAVADVQERVELHLIRADPDPGRKLRLVGWNVGGLGLAMVATSVVLFAVDGRGLDCSAVPGAECPRQQDTRAAAWTLLSVGVAAVATAAVLIVRGRRPR